MEDLLLSLVFVLSWLFAFSLLHFASVSIVRSVCLTIYGTRCDEVIKALDKMVADPLKSIIFKSNYICQ